jgi:hypothetical protein
MARDAKAAQEGNVGVEPLLRTDIARAMNLYCDVFKDTVFALESYTCTYQNIGTRCAATRQSTGSRCSLDTRPGQHPQTGLVSPGWPTTLAIIITRGSTAAA